MSMTTLAQSQYKQLNVYDMKLEFDQLFLMADFKDIDYMYYLFRRYQQILEPSIAKMGGGEPSEQEE